VRRCVLVLAVVLLPRVAHAQAPAAAPEMELSYLWDGGAIPFFWGALAGRLAIDHYLDPPATPRLFSPDEGGETPSTWEVPGWTVSATGGLVALAIAIGGDSSRWYHAKGLGESLATGVLVTGALKITFGRHRPDYPDGELGGENRSFPSGHATQAFAVATYSALYLRRHVFGGEIGWREVVSDAAIFGAASLCAAERVYHHRHYVGDVVAGAVLGSAASIAFFLYQDHRFRHDGIERRLPTVTPTRAGVQLGWAF
jgi:membrane-associated phospholipid phosphatase